MDRDQEERLFASLVYLADSLVSEFDIVDLATRLVQTCQELLPVQSAGIMLDDQSGHLQVLASSTEEGRALELLELQNNEGPCLDAFCSGEPVLAIDLATADRWPGFVQAALAQGVTAAYAIPLRLRSRIIGALNIFATGELEPRDLEVAKVLADIATIGILSHRNLREQEQLAEQLQTALNSRIAIEQAKGVIAERLGCTTAAAFDILRSTARDQQRALADLAVDVVQGRVQLEAPAQQTLSSQD